MKKIIIIIFLAAFLMNVLAQLPGGISHQAVIRNAANEVVSNATVGIRVSILQYTETGTPVYIETHTPVSNSNGLISFIIGQGNALSGVFNEIDWTDGPYYLKMEADPDGGTNYNITGISQVMSVPYAFDAQQTGSINEGTNPGEMIYWNGEAWITIPPGTHNQVLKLIEGVPQWESVYYVLDLLVQPEISGIVTGEGQYEAGEQINITAEANPGWVFVNWTDEDDIEVSAIANFLYTMPAQDVTITANFDEEPIWQPCPGMPTFTDPRDGQTYNTVQIGSQCWMKENLNYTTASSWCYDNNTANCSNYGRLYTWSAALNACPPGWHLPSDAEWTQLVDYVVAQGFPNQWDNPNGAGNALKSCRQVNSPLGGECNTTEHPRWEEDTWSGIIITVLTRSAFRRFRAATAIPMAISTTLATTVTGGVLRSAHQRVPGTGTWAATTATWAAAAPVRRTGSASVASGILINLII